jgi:predicted ester cyclase
MPTSTDANKALVARFYEGFNSGDLSVYDEILAEDWQDHPIWPGQHPGRAGFGMVVSMFRDAFEGLTIAQEVVVAEGEHVACRITLRGRHVKDWAGHPATGRQTTFYGLDMHHVVGGLIRSTWHFEKF